MSHIWRDASSVNKTCGRRCLRLYAQFSRRGGYMHQVHAGSLLLQPRRTCAQAAQIDYSSWSWGGCDLCSSRDLARNPAELIECVRPYR